ncbi:MAG: YhfC family intramembrane metalloprotease [Clostridiales bacterium]|nr:YhfC family intramembrane metalloprotease [Clostridiales bacterium]
MPETTFVSSDRLLFMFITLGLSVLFPIALWIVFALRKKRVTAAVLAGTVGFVVPQLFIRVPVLQLMALNQQWVAFCARNTVLSCAFYASTAALFETAGRILVLRGLLHKSLSYDTALGAGLGHGAAESIGLIGMTYVNNIILSFMINAGTLPAAPELQPAVEALTQTQPSLFLLAGLERVFTIAFHMALTTVLSLFILKKDLFKGALLVIAMHFAVDFIVPLAMAKGLNAWAAECIICLVALGSAALIALLKSKFPVVESPEDPAAIALREGY